MLKKIFGILLAVSFAAGSLSCSGGRTYSTVEGAMLGTTMHIVADIPAESAADLYAAAMALDAEAKASMSIFDEGSLLNRINRNETDSLDEHLLRNLRVAEEIYRLSGGRYDVTVKPLVEAWGFAGHAPDARPNVDSLLQFVGFDRLRIEAGRLVKGDPRIEIDLNSIAKGYTVDRLAELVERFGARNYVVDIGGECRCRGVNRMGGPWRIGVDSPYDGNMSPGESLQVRIALHDGALATSGNYRRYYIGADGRKVAHTIDPRTGRSAVSQLLSVTVVADDCMRADALGTMFLALGSEARAAAERMPDAKVYFIYAGEDGRYEVYASPAMQRLIMKD